MTKNEVRTIHNKIRRYLMQYSGVEVAEIELDLRKMAQSYIETISKLEEQKQYIERRYPELENLQKYLDNQHIELERLQRYLDTLYGGF